MRVIIKGKLARPQRLSHIGKKGLGIIIISIIIGIIIWRWN